MAIRRLNHAVLYVRDVTRSLAFYQDILGFRVVHQFPGAAFLQAEGSDNDHDLGLFQIGDHAGPSTAGRDSVGLYHLAWSVGTLRELAEYANRLRTAGALVGASDHITTKALYAKDPDGLEFEVSWLVPLPKVTPEMRANPKTLPLDLDAEITRWGGDLVGAL
ncbi:MULTISPECIES: VOC family protein [unclassified Crossiella]|uniref:VOC family protein n=1 Tax=unclassified Crossiella TaxID=2620835 RepID=UPI001FFE5471|nr:MULTISPECIES: VOC family protein [unclassified Crossiella]MCK2243895.1 VOC family protein [Crossiella sp. S99.2]MCK2257247.1 VOC family protein [Crossiella sp. S99.1]